MSSARPPQAPAAPAAGVVGRPAGAVVGPAGRPGMTLVEIMIVLTIMAGIMAFAAYSVVGYLKSSKVKDAQAEVNQIRGFIDTYRVMQDKLPDDLDNLTKEEAGMGPVTERVPNDPWNNPYDYRKNNDGTFVLFSMGPDGQSGTDDDIYPEGMGPQTGH